MKKIYLILFTIVAFLNSSLGQQNNSKFNIQYTNFIDSMLLGLDKNLITTGILYDRAVPLSGLQFHKQNSSVNKSYFFQAYNEIRNASYEGRNLITTDSIRTIADNYSYREKFIPIGILNYRFNYIDTLAPKKGLINIDAKGKSHITRNLSKEDIKEKEIFIASILSENKTLDLQNRFILVPELILKNMDMSIYSLKINFDDGLGFRPMDLNKPINVNYSQKGVKKIIVCITDRKGVEKTSAFSITVAAPEGSWGLYGLNRLRQQPIYADLLFRGYNESVGFRGLGWVTYLYKNSDWKIRKPILVVDGFDPGNERTDDTLFFNYLNNPKGIKFADRLYQNGYDLIILDLPKAFNSFANKVVDGGGDYIERNAMVTIKVIQEINRQLTANGSNEKLVIIGPSMGGLITRYALAYMEKNGLTHNTRLWVSFDSPHQGANIPIGVQRFVDYFAGTSDDAKKNRDEKLNCIAALQMLIHHYTSGSESPTGAPNYRDNFINSLNSIGFPQNLRKITVLNGSLNSTLTSTPCTRAATMSIKGKFIWGWSEIGWGYINTSSGYGDRCLIFRGITPQVFSTTSYYAVGFSGSNSLDNSPGGINNTFEQMAKNIVSFQDVGDNVLFYRTEWSLAVKSHSFIPVKSAFAFSGSNQDYSENISERDLVATGETPFQSYWGPLNKNMNHISFDTDMAIWLMDEINGIPKAPRLGHDLVVSGPNAVCSSGANYSVNYPPAGCSIIWSYSPNLTLTSPQGSYTGTFSPNGAGNGWIKATIKSQSDTLSLKKIYVLVGSPTPSLSAYLLSASGEPTTIQFTASAYSTVTYNWYVNGVLQQGETSNIFDLYFPCRVTKTVKCSLTTSCGTSGYSSSLSPTGECTKIPSYIISPNPASSTVNISTLSPKTVTDSVEATYHSFDFVRVFDFQGNLKKFIKCNKVNSTSIIVSGWMFGTYIFEIGNSDYSEKHQVIITK